MNHKVFTRHDYLSIEDIRELNTEMQALALALGVLAQVSNLDTDLGTSTMATPALINQIERNIDVLAGAALPAEMQPTRTWQGENRDVPLLSFRDVNRWFESIGIIKQSLGRAFVSAR